MRRLPVEIWSDIACPWCYIGKRRFERALSRFAHADAVHVLWRSFELDPSAPRVHDTSLSHAARLARKYGTTPAQAEGMIERVRSLAAQEGLAFDYTRLRSGNTFDAHRLLHLAQRHGLQGALKERFMRAYFCEGCAMGDHESLLALASEVGLPTDEVQGVLMGDLYAAEVRADQRAAQSIGVDGVPFFVIGQRYAIAGAQPAELLLQALDQAWQEGLGEDLPEPAADAVCTPEGCE